MQLVQDNGQAKGTDGFDLTSGLGEQLFVAAFKWLHCAHKRPKHHMGSRSLKTFILTLHS